MNDKNQIHSEEIKKRIFEILKYFKSICDEENIHYSLSFGTLLGAVRHKGFIPWDDDIDVCLLRSDYDKLLKILKKKENCRYKLFDIESNESYYYNFAKLVDTETEVTEIYNKPIKEYGLYIDIFPLDNCPAEEKEFTYYVKKIKLLSIMKTASVVTKWNNSVSYVHNIMILLLSIVAKLFGYKFWVECVEQLLRKYQNIKTGYVCCLTEYPSFKERISISDLQKWSTILFENEQFGCFADFDKYLSNRYGDYMVLPPIEQQKTHHNYYAKLK